MNFSLIIIIIIEKLGYCCIEIEFFTDSCLLYFVNFYQLPNKSYSRIYYYWKIIFLIFCVSLIIRKLWESSKRPPGKKVSRRIESVVSFALFVLQICRWCFPFYHVLIILNSEFRVYRNQRFKFHLWNY